MNIAYLYGSIMAQNRH